MNVVEEGRLDGVPDDTPDIAYLGVEMTHGEGRSVRDAIDAIEGVGWQAEAERQEELAKVYRRAQLTAEEKLCREEANAKGWQKRAERLEQKLAALSTPVAQGDEARDAKPSHLSVIPVRGHPEKHAVFDAIMGDAIAVCPDEIAAQMVFDALTKAGATLTKGARDAG